MSSPAERIKVSIATKTKPRWGLNLLWAVLGQYPDERDDERVTVTVEDTALGSRWTFAVRSYERGVYIERQIHAKAAELSERELDEWSRNGLWESLTRAE